MNIFRKHAGKLEPTDDAGRVVLSRIEEGSLVNVTVTRPRNLAWHRRYWAALQLVFENQSYFKTVDLLHAAVKVGMDYADLVMVRDTHGVLRETYVPKSESFSKMTQDEFETFWNDFCDFVCARIIPGMNKEDFVRELEELIGMRGY